jgi:hypothetical protein
LRVWRNARRKVFAGAATSGASASDEPWARSEHEGFSFPSLP